MSSSRFFLLLVALVLGSSAAAFAGISPITLTVRSDDVTAKAPPNKGRAGAGAMPKAEAEDRKLQIGLRNSSNQPYAGLKVKYFFLGRSAGSEAVKVLLAGEETTDVAAGGALQIESKVGHAEYQDSYTTRPKRGSNERPEHMKASGEKHVGWAVIVYAGNAIVAEAYSNPTMKGAALSAAPAQ